MAGPDHNEESRETRTKHHGLSVSLPWLLVAALGLFVLILLPRERQEKLAAAARKMTPSIRTGSTEGEAENEAPEGGYKALYEAKVAQLNDVLQVLKGRPHRKYREIEAEVLKRDPYEGYFQDTQVLSRGSDDGVLKGMVVTNRDRVAVGQVVTVERTTCTMLPVTSPNVSMAVYIPARNLCAITRAEPALSHTGELGLLLPPPTLFVTAIQEDEMRATGRVAQKREPQFLQPGDQVFTMSTSGSDSYADGVLLGSVSHLSPVEKSSAGWPLRARVIPGRLDTLRFVRIVVPQPFAAHMPSPSPSQ